jgi:hyperosmotically inducible protein
VRARSAANLEEQIMNGMKVVALVAVLGTVQLAGCASTEERSPPSSGSSVGSYLEDAALTARVKAALAAAGVSPTAVHVTSAQGGVVQLSGFVNSPDDARRAAEIARHVDGVKTVYDDIRITTRS